MSRILLLLGLCAALAPAFANDAARVPPARVVELPARQLGADQRAELRRNVLAEQAEQARRAQTAQVVGELQPARPRQLSAEQRAQLRQLLREQANPHSQDAPPPVRR